MIERRERTAIAVITALAALSRLAALRQPMRFDEAVSWAYYVGRSWDTITDTYRQPNNHVLYSLLAKLVAADVDYAPWALRLPALVAGIAIVPLTWAVGRRFADARTGLLAAALAVGSTQLILYSTNARGYSLVVALFLVLLLIADDLRTSPTTARWMAFAVTAAAGLYTIPVMLYPLGVVAVWLAMYALTATPAGTSARRFQLQLGVACLAAGLLACALYLPIIRTEGFLALTGNKFVLPSPWRVFVGDIPRMVLSTLVSWANPLPIWSTPLLAGLAIVGWRRRAPRDRPSLGLAVAIWCIVLLLATHRAPFGRVWLFLLPLFLLAVSRGVWTCVEWATARDLPQAARASTAVAVVMLAIAVATRDAERLDDTGVFRPAERVAVLLAPLLRPGDRVLAPIPTIGPLLYYFPRAGADTAFLTVSLASSRRAFVVLDAHLGRTLDWAYAHHVIDRVNFSRPALVARYPEGEVWETERRTVGP